MKNNQIEIKGIEIRHNKINEDDYICITDIVKAKNPNRTGLVIFHWLCKRSTIEYLGLWETLNNRNFNVTEFGNIKSQFGGNVFVLTVQEWDQKTNAIGIISRVGRYGGECIHQDMLRGRN